MHEQVQHYRLDEGSDEEDTAKLAARVAQIEGAIDPDFGQPDSKKLRGAWNGKRSPGANPNRFGSRQDNIPPPPPSAPPAPPSGSDAGKPNCARIQSFGCKYARPDLEIFAVNIVRCVATQLIE